MNILSAEGKGISRLQKPDKIFLENTNLAYAIDPNPDKGNMRDGDFFISGLTIEAGGKSKTGKQVQHTGNYLVAADDIETGLGTKVPLWLFSFLY
ncbi:hypothetical protein [Pedobacter sp. GR22-6]|uniref:hypothetical protein n=1 Tax=Pedobacter sp. GR22-6 TaxID=3127957 RepID=UPI00307FB110